MQRAKRDKNCLFWQICLLFHKIFVRMYGKNFRNVDHLDCQIIVFKVKINVFLGDLAMLGFQTLNRLDLYFLNERLVV